MNLFVITIIITCSLLTTCYFERNYAFEYPSWSFESLYKESLKNAEPLEMIVKKEYIKKEYNEPFKRMRKEKQMIDSLVTSTSSGFQLYPSISMCSEYTDYLKSYNTPQTEPFIVDIIGHALANETHIYLVVSLYHLKDKEREPEEHQDYSIVLNNVRYDSVFDKKNSYIYFSLMKYILPFPVVPTSSSQEYLGSLNITIYNNVQKRVYSNYAVCILPTQSDVLPHHKLTLCAYVSVYNSIEELHQWLSYHYFLGFDYIILYKGTEIVNMDIILAPLIRKNKLKIYDWKYPRIMINRYYPLQLSNQYAGVNSCVFRNLYYTDYMMLFDTDEYVYSNREEPKSLMEEIQAWSVEYPQYDVFQMKSNMMMAKTKTWQDRKSLYKSGKFFSYYNRVLPESESGRIKLLLKQNADGLFGLHDCFSCKMICPENDTLRMAHYKLNIWRKIDDTTDRISRYADAVLEKRLELFGE